MSSTDNHLRPPTWAVDCEELKKANERIAELEAKNERLRERIKFLNTQNKEFGDGGAFAVQHLKKAEGRVKELEAENENLQKLHYAPSEFKKLQAELKDAKEQSSNWLLEKSLKLEAEVKDLRAKDKELRGLADGLSRFIIVPPMRDVSSSFLDIKIVGLIFHEFEGRFNKRVDRCFSRIDNLGKRVSDLEEEA